MQTRLDRWSFGMFFLLILAGCSQPPARISYHNASSAVDGYTLVVPRTVVNVSESTSTKPATADAASGGGANQPANQAGNQATAQTQADGNDGAMTLSVAPEVHDTSGKLLPVFDVTDDSASLFSLTPTTVTSVSYVVPYVIKTIGTEVTDNRSKAIDASVAVLGVAGKIAGAGFAGQTAEDCTKPGNVPAFTITSFEQATPSGSFVPKSNCWGYKVDIINTEEGPDVSPVLNADGSVALPVETKVSWFPYPACRSVLVTVYQCDSNDTTTCTPLSTGKSMVAAVNVSTGKYYRRMVLPGKGQISMHPDLCAADVTNDTSGYTSGWALVQDAITDYKNLSGAGKSTSGQTATNGGAQAQQK